MPRPTRRRLLATLGTGVAALAGCDGLHSGSGELSPSRSGSPPPSPTPFDPGGVETRTDLQFRETPERSLALDYTRPAAEATVPVVVHCHPGGWRRGSKGYPYADRLVEAGVAVASVEYRLSGEARFPAAVRDVVAAVKWVRANAADLGVDPDHVGLIGGSAGAHLAALVGAAPTHPDFQPADFLPDTPSAVDAVVAVSGIYDLREGFLCRSDIVQQFLGGSCEERPERAARASPVTHVDSDDPPALLYHGTDDEVITIEQAELYRDAMDDAGASVDLFTDEGGGHLLRNATRREEFLHQQATFLADQLDAPPT